MADGLAIFVRAPSAIRHPIPEPRDALEEAFVIEGREPEVQLFNGASEQKLSPNYTDYENRLLQTLSTTEKENP
jgi:hypothetical protein